MSAVVYKLELSVTSSSRLDLYQIKQSYHISQLAGQISSYRLDLSVKLSNFCMPLFYFDYQHLDYYCPTDVYIKISKFDLHHQALKKALLTRTFCPLAPYRQRWHWWQQRNYCVLTYRLTAKNTDRLTPPTHSPYMPAQSTRPNPLNLSWHGSTNYSLAPPPFTQTSPKQPTDLMTGALLQISHATANWMTTCPVSMPKSNDSMLKWMLQGSQKLYAKGNWSWLVPPSSWPTWSAWCHHSFAKGTNNLPLKGDGRSPHMVMLARAGGNVTSLRWLWLLIRTAFVSCGNWPLVISDQMTDTSYCAYWSSWSCLPILVVP